MLSIPVAAAAVIQLKVAIDSILHRGRPRHRTWQDWPSRRLSLGRNYFVLVFLRLIERPNRAAFFRMVAGERLKRTAMASKVREGASSISSRSLFIDQRPTVDLRAILVFAPFLSGAIGKQPKFGYAATAELLLR